jgi:hypothetical protein
MFYFRREREKNNTKPTARKDIRKRTKYIMGLRADI